MRGLNVRLLPSPLSATTTTQRGRGSRLPDALAISTLPATVKDEKARQNMAAMLGSVWASAETARTISLCHGTSAWTGKGRTSTGSCGGWVLLIRELSTVA